MVPCDRLFATLDVTSHGGMLPNRMMVLYIDTVGFISNLPRNMKSAFIATLENTISAVCHTVKLLLSEHFPS